MAYRRDKTRQKEIAKLSSKVECRDLTVAEIARRFAMSEAGVDYILRKVGMTKRLKRKDPPWKKTLSLVEQDQLREWFIGLNWGGSKIKKEMRLTSGNIQWLLKKYGIDQEKRERKMTHHWCSGFLCAGRWKPTSEFGIYHRHGKCYYNHLCKLCYRINKNKKERRRWRNNIKWRLNQLVSGEIRKSLKGKKNGRSWQVLVGYTVNDLKKHLEHAMPEGYIWQDYLQGSLHIDHLVPLAAFAFTKPEDFAFHEAWALTNLQLLPKNDNLAKGSKLPFPVQQLLPLEIS